MVALEEDEKALDVVYPQVRSWIQSVVRHCMGTQPSLREPQERLGLAQIVLFQLLSRCSSLSAPRFAAAWWGRLMCPMRRWACLGRPVLCDERLSSHAAAHVSGRLQQWLLIAAVVQMSAPDRSCAFSS